MKENEKLEWIGRQIRILKAKPGEEGKKECEANAKQMAPAFTSVDELEVLNFFIHEGGGSGDGSNGGSDSGEGKGNPASGEDPSTSEDGGKKDKPVDKSASGGTDKSEKVLPDGSYEIVRGTESESYLYSIPADSFHRIRRGVPVTDDKEFAEYMFSAFGPKFTMNKYGNSFSLII